MNNLNEIFGEIAREGYKLKSLKYRSFSTSLDQTKPVSPAKLETRVMVAELTSGILVYPRAVSAVFIHPNPRTSFQAQVAGSYSKEGYIFKLLLKPHEKKVLTGDASDNGYVLNPEDYQDFQKIFEKYNWKVKNKVLEMA